MGQWWSAGTKQCQNVPRLLKFVMSGTFYRVFVPEANGDCARPGGLRISFLQSLLSAQGPQVPDRSPRGPCKAGMASQTCFDLSLTTGFRRFAPTSLPACGGLCKPS